MDGRLINQCMRNDRITSKNFYGAWPSDLIPPISRYPTSFIVNTDPHNRPGQHWVALYFDKQKHCIYFDSFGLKPQENILNYIKVFSLSQENNNKMLQSFYTTTCGQYCMYFLFWQSRGVTMQNIVERLDNKFSDEIVKQFVDSVFRIKI